jgi:hypothetical protein
MTMRNDFINIEGTSHHILYAGGRDSSVVTTAKPPQGTAAPPVARRP